MKQFKTAGILFLVLFALGLLATWDEWKTKKDDATKSAQNRLADFDPALVTRIDFENTGNDPAEGEGTAAVPLPTLKLKAAKGDSGWTVTEPIATKADIKAIENLLSTLKDYKYEKVAADNLNEAAKFGLSPPRRRVTAFVGDKVVADILVGANAPVGYHVYSANSSQGPVYIGSQYLAVATNKSLFDLREKSLARFNIDEVSSFTLRSFASNPFTITQQNKSFKVTAPETADADPLSVKNFLEDMERAPVVEIIDTPSADLQKSFAGGTEAFVKWTLNDGSTNGLTAVEIGKEVYSKLTDKPALFRMGLDFKKKFSQKSADFRDRRIFRFTSAEVSSVDVNGKEFKKVGDEWFEPEHAAKFSPDGKFQGAEEAKPASNASIRSLIVDLEFARAIDFLEGDIVTKGKTDAAPVHRVTLNFPQTTGKSALTIDLWPEKSSSEPKPASGSTETWILRNGETQKFYRVSKSLVETLSSDGKSKAQNSESPMPSEGSDRTQMDVALPEAVDDAAKNDISGISN